MPKIYFPSEGRRAGDFFALKNPTLSAGFEPANLGTRGQHASSRPSKPLFVLPDCACVFASRKTLEPESTQHKQTGRTPDEEVKINHFTVDVGGYNDSDQTEEFFLSNSRLSGPTKYICFEPAV
jgi:hypothetical protein